MIPEDDRIRYGAAEEILSRADVDGHADEWFQLRRQGITATDIAPITGNDDMFGHTAFTVYWTKVEDMRRNGTKSMQSGLDWQEQTLELAFRRGQEIFGDRWRTLHRPGLLSRVDAPWQLASPDGVVFERGMGIVPVECKVSNKYEIWGPEGSDQIPMAYQCQVKWQMQVLGAPIGYVAALMPNHQVRLYAIPADPDIAWLVEQAEAFRTEYLIPENPPMAIGTGAELSIMKRIQTLNPEATYTANMEMVQVLSDLRHARAMQRDYKKLAEKAEVRIRELVGSAKTVVDSEGHTLATRKLIGRKGYSVDPVEYEVIRLPKEEEDA